MPFKGILEDLTKSVNADGAIMLDWEGEAVDSYSSESDGTGGAKNSEHMELAAIGAHKGIILNMLHDATSRFEDSGDVKNVGITTAGARIAISIIKDGYYILLVMGKLSPFGKAFFESEKAVKRLMAEMY
jgi:hypothetical protein